MNNAPAPYLPKRVEPQVPCIGLRIDGAAKASGVSPRTLWEWANRDDDPVPFFRIRRVLVFPVDLLVEWHRRQAEKAIEQRDRDGGQPGNGEAQ